MKHAWIANTKATKDQMNRYDKSIIKSKKLESFSGTHPTRGTTDLNGNFDYGIYDVSYKYHSEGLITYHISLDGEEVMNRVVATVSIVVTIALLAIGVYSGVPGYQPQYN